ncbi:MAG: hypothetical protein JNM90_12135 [Burkholderiales bacterium]|nr:hypothetical protein [Burkholderiales bacterium]
MLRNLFAFVTGIVALAAAFMFSLVLLAVLLVVGVVVGGYFWWKTRALRRAMREAGGREAAMRPGARGGEVIEGEAVVVEETVSRTVTLLPGDDARKP